MVLKAAGFVDMPEEEKAVKFLEKLDMQRYGYMTAELMNGVRMGQPYPDTLHKAWDISANWVRSGVTSSTGEKNFHSVFLADERSDVKPKRGKKKIGKTSTSAAVSKKAVSFAEEPVTKAQRPKLRTCYRCGKTGQLKLDCPNNSEEKIHLTSEELGDDDFEDYHEDEWDSAFVTGAVADHRQLSFWPFRFFAWYSEIWSSTFYFLFSLLFNKNKFEEIDNAVLFGAHELLLDNESSVSVFRDNHLLQNVRSSSNPIQMGGIQSDSPRLHVTEQGDFGSFGTVHHSKSAAANILSFAAMVDIGCDVKYSAKKDAFRLTSPDNK